jgi:hypothetical protein
VTSLNVVELTKWRLPAGRIRVAAVAVAASDPPIAVVNPEFGALTAADLPTLVDSLPLRVVVAAGAFAAAPLHIPAALRVADYMVGFGTLSHRSSNLDLGTKSIATPNVRIPPPLPLVKHLLYG